MTSLPRLPDGPVVVGVGGNPQNLVAVRLAARVAATYDRPLLALHAFNWAAAPVAPGAGPSLDAGISPRVSAERLLAAAVAAATEAAPGLPVSEEIAEGPAVAVLAHRSQHAMLVVVGAGELATGGCVPQDAPALQLAAHADSPVLVIRTEPPRTGPVLVGIDSSATAPDVLAIAAEHADRRGLELLVIRIIEDETLSDAGQATVAEELAAHVAAARRRFPKVTLTYRVLPGDPQELLTDLSHSAALVAVGARGDEPWRGSLGAVSQALLFHSPAPVLVVRGLAGPAQRRT